MLLFIAPVSAFNQTLSEDRKVNRLVSFGCLWSPHERLSRGLVTGFIVGFVPFVEIAVHTQAIEKGDFCVATQQIRHPGCKTPVWDPVSRICHVLQRQTEQHEECFGV